MITTAEQLRIYRAMSPERRIALACQLHDFAHQRVVLHLQRKHPDEAKTAILKRAARRFLGDAARVL
jgi:hypothetical protein